MTKSWQKQRVLWHFNLSHSYSSFPNSIEALKTNSPVIKLPSSLCFLEDKQGNMNLWTTPKKKKQSADSAPKNTEVDF
jgi:hypothetical protein